MRPGPATGLEREEVSQARSLILSLRDRHPAQVFVFSFRFSVFGLTIRAHRCADVFTD
jgi:hypothetical protein